METAASALAVTAAMVFSLSLAVLAEELVTGTLFRFVFHRKAVPARVQASATEARRACFGPKQRLN